MRATVAKNRTEAYLPIHAGLVGRLAAWFDAYGVEPTDPSPFGWVAKTKTAEMVRVDLAAAGIDYETETGVVDFHALRVTFITSLHRAGVPLATAQKLARQSDSKLTSNVYGRMDLFDLTGAVARLPGFHSNLPNDVPQSSSIGADDSAIRLFGDGENRTASNGPAPDELFAERLATTTHSILGAAMGALPTAKTCRTVTTVEENDHQRYDQDSSTETTEVKEVEDDGASLATAEENAPGWTRTSGRRIRNPLLYPTELRERRGRGGPGGSVVDRVGLWRGRRS